LLPKKNTTTRKVPLKNCIHCSKQIRITSKFCSFCGKSVVPPVQNPPDYGKTVKCDSYLPPAPSVKENLKKIPSVSDVKKPPAKKVKSPRTKPEKLNPCPYCQEIIPVGEMICQACYRSLKKCSVCNIVNRGTAKFCRSCQSLFPYNKMDWPTFRGNNFREGFFNTKLEFPFYFQWMYPVLDDTLGPLWASPVVARDIVFVAAREKYLYAFNQFTGKLLWKQPTGSPVTTTPAVEDKMVYAGCEDGKVFAIDAEKGGVRWYYEAEGEIGSSVMSSEDMVYVPLKEGRILVLNSSKDGSMVWCFPHRKYAPIKEIVSSISLWKDMLFFSTTSNFIYALSCRNAKVMWKHKMKAPVVSSMAIYNGTGYVIDRAGNMSALDLTTGRDLWAGVVELPGPFTASPGIKEDLVIVASQRGVVYALELRTGGVKWEINFHSSSSFEAINSSPVLTKEHIIIGTDAGNLYILEESSGRNLWQFRTNSWIWASPAVSHDYVYITSNDGHVYAFSRKKPDIDHGIMKIL